jgi:hypothetical protein
VCPHKQAGSRKGWVCEVRATSSRSRRVLQLRQQNLAWRQHKKVDKKLPATMSPVAQDTVDTKKVWMEFRKEVKGQNYIIRKLNEKELKYYWSIISFDIDEPLFILETKDHKYILNILKDTMKLMWLDELPVL